MLQLFLFLRYLNFCPEFCGHVGERPDKKVKINFKINDVTDWEMNNCNTHIVQYLKKQGQSENEIWSCNRIYIMRNIFLKKSCTICGQPLYQKSKFSISLDQQSEILYKRFLLHVQVKVYKNVLKLRCF